MLAAGTARRMGYPKQLLPWDGTTLLGHAVAEAQAVAGASVFVVTGAHRDLVEPHVDTLGVAAIFNPHFEDGLGTSIAAAAAYLLDAGDRYLEVVIMLADQPSVTSGHLTLLIEHSRTARSAAATAYPRGNGVPAAFPWAMLDALQNLGGDAGARQLLNGEAFSVVRVHPQVPLFDIDTPENYRAHEGDQKRH